MQDINDSNLNPIDNNYEKKNVNFNKIDINVNQEPELNVIPPQNNSNIKEVSIPIEENFEQYKKNKDNDSIIKKCINYLDILDKRI